MSECYIDFEYEEWLERKKEEKEKREWEDYVKRKEKGEDNLMTYIYEEPAQEKHLQGIRNQVMRWKYD